MADTTLPEWPAETPTAAEMMRYTVAEGLHYSAISIDLTDKPLAHLVAIGTIIGAHDRYLLLRVLSEIDPAVADRLAARMWTAAEAGDSYGEWLYQWAEEQGLDAEAICASAKSSARLHALRSLAEDGA